VGSRWLAGAFLLALAVPLLEALFPRLELTAGSLAALALLPWLLVALVPRTRASEAPLGALAFVLALALPPLALGAGLDLARGAEPRALALAGGTSLLVLALWCAAAELAAGARSARGAFAAAWLVLVPGLAVLRFALDFVPSRVAESAPSALVFSLDPLVLCHGWGRAGGLAGSVAAPASVALLGAVLVLGLVLALRRTSREAGASP
jgi:hypothetical protein